MDVSTPEGLPDKIEDQPVVYRKKSLLRAGVKYQAPNGVKFGPFTHAQLDEIAKKHNILRDSIGYKPYVPTNHNKPADSKDNRGYLVGFAREGDDLVGVHQLIGNDAKLDAARNGSSVAIDFDWEDHTGKKHGAVIVHNSLTPNPHITDLGAFTMLSKDGTAESVPVLTEVKTMDWNVKLREALGITSTETISDDDLLAKLKTKLTGDTAQIAKLSKDVTDRTTERDDFKNQLTSERAKVVQFSKDPFTETELGLMSRLAVQTIESKIGVGDGKISPDQATRIKAALKAGNKPSTVMFSKDADGKEMWEHLLDVATAVKSPPEGEKTATQTDKIELSRDVPGETNKEKPMTDKRRDELLSLTSVGRAVIAGRKSA